MSTIIKSTGNGEFSATPEGTYIARCIKVIFLGTQTTTGQFGTTSRPQVMITWELLDDEVKMEDGRPFAATQFYTASLHEKAKLRKDLEAWRGKKFTDAELEGFDLKDVLGTFCMLQIVHSADGQYANVNAIMSYKGSKPEGINELVLFDIENPDETVLNAMSEKMQEKIKNSPEYSGSDWPSGKKAKDIVIQDIPDEINLEDIPDQFKGDDKIKAASEGLDEPPDFLKPQKESK